VSLQGTVGERLAAAGVPMGSTVSLSNLPIVLSVPLGQPWWAIVR
jgi:hypothetical protein